MNCPNCGAPVNGNICEYCGTVHNICPKQDLKIDIRLDTALLQEAIYKANVAYQTQSLKMIGGSF